MSESSQPPESPLKSPEIEAETLSFRDTVTKFEASRFMIRSAAPGKYAGFRETSFSGDPDEEPVTEFIEVKTHPNSPRRPNESPPPVPQTPPPEELDEEDEEGEKQMDEAERADAANIPTDLALKSIPPQTAPKPILKKPKKPAKLTPPPKQKPKGIWFNMINQYPVENFSGRLKYLERLETLVVSPKSRDVRPISLAIVLVGPKQIGKTEIARKFAFRFYVEANGCGNVVWLDATSKDSIKDGLLSLYEKEFVPPTPTGENGDEEAEPAAKDKANEKSPPKVRFSPKLNSSKKPPPRPTVDQEIDDLLKMKTFQLHPSLFVFDNARCEEDVIDFLPKLSPIGFIPSVLITSRNKNWNNSRVIPVEEMDFTEAVDFLEDNLKQYPEFRRYQGEDLAKDLHRFPPLLQRAKHIVANYVDSIGSERALLKLEKNIGLVRRLKHEAPFNATVEKAMLAVDRGVFWDIDPYIREYDQPLPTHSIMVTIRQLEVLAPHLVSLTNGEILAINEEPYTLALLSCLLDKGTTISAVYDSNRCSPAEVNEMQTKMDCHDPKLLKMKIIQFLSAEAAKQKTVSSKIGPLLEKIRSQNPKKQYNAIFTTSYEDDDITQVRKLLQVGGVFVTSTSSANTTVLLKKNDSKKTELKILKQEFQELLVVIRKLQ